MKEKILNELKEYKDLILYANYTKKGLTIRFDDNKCKMVKVKYSNDYLKELQENENRFFWEMFNLKNDLKY